MISVFLTNTSFHQYFCLTQPLSLLVPSCVSLSVSIYILLFLSPCYNDMWDTWKVNLCIIFLLFLATAAVRPNTNKIHERGKDMKNRYLLLLAVTFTFLLNFDLWICKPQFCKVQYNQEGWDMFSCQWLVLFIISSVNMELFCPLTWQLNEICFSLCLFGFSC